VRAVARASIADLAGASTIAAEHIQHLMLRCEFFRAIRRPDELE